MENNIISTKEEVKGKIGAIRDEVYMRSSNSSELPTLMKLMTDVENGKIDPSEALKEARYIADIKQDYH